MDRGEVILFTPAEKTFQYRVTGITTDGFKAKPALTKHGVEEVTVSKMDLVRSLSGGASIKIAVDSERMRELEMHALDALGALWQVQRTLSDGVEDASAK